MDSDYQTLVAYLVDVGFQDVPHYPESPDTLLGHSLGLYDLMRAQGCSEELCRAGMFHQIYGVQGLPVLQLSLECREEVAALLGKRAEHLVYLNCAMDRDSFDTAVERETPPYRFIDHFTGQEIEVGPADFDDLCRLQLYDRLEQVARTRGWDYRRAEYERMAMRLGAVEQKAYASVYAQEPTRREEE